MVIGIESFKEWFRGYEAQYAIIGGTACDLLQSGRVGVDGITVLDAAYLILFKVKAWLDFTIRKADGERIDSKDIRKHKNDVFRLSALLGKNTKVTVNRAVWEDMQAFIEAMEDETVDLKQLGIVRAKKAVLSSFQSIYVLK